MIADTKTKNGNDLKRYSNYIRVYEALYGVVTDDSSAGRFTTLWVALAPEDRHKIREALDAVARLATGEGAR